ncbi:hypothetical protein LSTR_LSTR015103 [Laodelphax striatellus]|uniref:Uncharacterized protein n=1 Tax=Laodelphax striatellus TaxID=195883 RepID=A0A482WYC3_LAOST|nr:hypothetical protein LSTR_LSTR015103 [Laodelphax striatellus]
MKSSTDSSEVIIKSSGKFSSQDKSDKQKIEKNKFDLELDGNSSSESRTISDKDVHFQEGFEIDTTKSSTTDSTSSKVFSQTVSNQSETKQISSSDSMFIANESNKHSIVEDNIKQTDKHISDSKQIVDKGTQKEQSVRLVGGKIVKSGVDDYSYYTSKSKEKKHDSDVTTDFQKKERTDDSNKYSSISNTSSDITQSGTSSRFDKKTADDQMQFIAAEKLSKDTTQKSVGQFSSSKQYDTKISSKELYSRGETTYIKDDMSDKVSKDSNTKTKNITSSDSFSSASTSNVSEDKRTDKEKKTITDDKSENRWQNRPAAGKPSTKRSPSPEKVKDEQQPDEPVKSQWKKSPAAGMPFGYSDHHAFSKHDESTSQWKDLPAAGKPTPQETTHSPEKNKEKKPSKHDEPMKSQWKNLPAAGMPSGYSDHHDSEDYSTNKDKQPSKPDESTKTGKPSGYSEHHDYSEGYPTDKDVRDKPNNIKKSLPAAGKPTQTTPRSQSPEKTQKEKPHKPEEPAKSQWKDLPAAGKPSGYSEHHDYSKEYPTDRDGIKDDEDNARKSSTKSVKRSPSPEKSSDGPDKKPKKSKPAAGKPTHTDKPEKVIDSKTTIDSSQQVIDDGFDIVMTDAVRMIGGKIVKTKVKTKVIKQDVNKGRRKSTESVDSSATYCVDEPMIVEFPYLDDTDHTTMIMYDNDLEAGRMMDFDDSKTITKVGREVWEKSDKISASKKISSSTSKTAVSKKSQSTKTTVYETRVMNEKGEWITTTKRDEQVLQPEITDFIVTERGATKVEDSFKRHTDTKVIRDDRVINETVRAQAVTEDVRVQQKDIREKTVVDKKDVTNVDVSSESFIVHEGKTEEQRMIQSAKDVTSKTTKVTRQEKPKPKPKEQPPKEQCICEICTCG